MAAETSESITEGDTVLGSEASNENMVRSVDSTTDTTNDALNDEDRLRQEAAKRLERRRRKMMSPEERLAKITGRPVSSTSPTNESLPSSNFTTESTMTSTNQDGSLSRNSLQVDDPPLETLTRDVSHQTRDSFSNFLPQGSGQESDLLSQLLGAAGGPQAAAGQGGQGAPAEGQQVTSVTDIVWVMLALAVRLILDTEFSVYIGDNCVMPYLLTLSLLYTLGYVQAGSSTVSSLLSAALMLCGVKAKLVGNLTKTLSFVQLLVRTLSLYLFTFFISHIIIIAVVDRLM